MADDQLTPETVTIERLHALFDAALYEVALQDDGHTLRITGDNILWITLADSRQSVRFIGVFALRDGTELGARLALANRINDHLIIVRAAVSGEQNERLWIDQYVWLAGGVAQKNVALAFRQFEGLVAAAIKEDKANVLA